jgi:hypothetical protein
MLRPRRPATRSRSTPTAFFCDSMAAMSIRLVPGRCECVGAFWAHTTSIRSS